MKTISTAGLAALNSGRVPIAVLVAMAFSPVPLNLCSPNFNLVAGGVTYNGVGGLGKISAVQTTASEIKQLQFEISGVPSANVSLVLNSPVQGTPVTVSLAILSDTYAVTDVVPIWVGALDTMVIEDTPSSATVTVTAEHIGIDLNRPAPLYYSDADQQTLHPGDLFFQYTSQQFDQQIVWPASAYFRK